jgi:hypothetical protein
MLAFVPANVYGIGVIVSAHILWVEAIEPIEGEYVEEDIVVECVDRRVESIALWIPKSVYRKRTWGLGTHDYAEERRWTTNRTWLGALVEWRAA